MRIRTVKPQFFRDGESTGVWPIDEKLVYAGLWSCADDRGRLAWNIRQIEADLFPFPEGMLLTRGGPSISVAAVLDRLVASGRVVVYKVAGREYAWLPNFVKHQNINRPSPSKLPPPPRLTERQLSEGSLRTHGALSESSVMEGKGREGNDRKTDRAVPDQRSDPLTQPASPRERATAPADGGGAGLAGDEVDRLQLDVAEHAGIEVEDFPIALARDEAHRGAIAARLRQAIARVGYERALVCCRQVIDAKAREGVEVRSLAFLLGFIERLPRHAAPARISSSPALPTSALPCDADGDRLKEQLRARLKPDLFERWFAPLGVQVLEDEILLVAHTVLAKQWLEDHYATLVADWSPELVGRELRVRVTAVGAPPGSVQ